MQFYKHVQIVMKAVHFSRWAFQESDSSCENKLSMKKMAKKHGVPYSSFHGRATGKVAGYHHSSGGKGRPKLLDRETERMLD